MGDLIGVGIWDGDVTISSSREREKGREDEEGGGPGDEGDILDNEYVVLFLMLLQLSTTHTMTAFSVPLIHLPPRLYFSKSPT